MPLRVIVHFGFHKTGTSTIEHTLLRNAALLAPHLKILGNAQLGAAIEAAKIYSVRRNPKALAVFAKCWQQVLDGLTLSPNQNLCISCVDLIGRIPGHPKVSNFAAGPKLIRTMKTGLLVRFGDQIDLRFVAGTRGADSWLKSLWAQNLKVRRLCADRDAFGAEFRPISNLAAQAKALEGAAAPYPILTAPLEIGRAHALGPSGPILDLFDLPSAVTDKITQQAPLKVSFSDDALALLLEMNRSDLDDTALKQTKAQAMQVFKAGRVE